ncbi:MAG: hypothetical protein Q7U88_12160 [Desulfocapsaceae bacterium]|nr:hypothetical protein [Desulfocapsaceae bacterium]
MIDVSLAIRKNLDESQINLVKPKAYEDMLGIMNEIRAGVESRDFSSLEEVQAALNQLTQKQNKSWMINASHLKSKRCKYPPCPCPCPE